MVKNHYFYFKSSQTEAKHEITRKELVKALGESDYCVRSVPLANGLHIGIADYEKAERLLRNAQRDRTGGTIWSCGGFSLYLEKDRSRIKRRRDSRYPD